MPMVFAAFGGATEVEDDVDGVPLRVLFAAATTLNNPPLLPRLFTFDGDDESSLSVECGPLELELCRPRVRRHIQGIRTQR